MKKFLLIIPLLAFMVSSCDDLSISGTKTDDILVVVDPAIVHTWEVVKYEAYDKQSNLINTVESQTDIHAGYWKFSFGSDSMMMIWHGNSSSPFLSVEFAYAPVLHVLYYGDYGEAEIQTLDSSAFVFDSRNFAPDAWLKEMDSSVGSIKFVRTYCIMADEQDQ